MSDTVHIETVTVPHRQLVMVCRKCSKKLDGGFGEDGAETLERALKRGLRAAGQRRDVRIVRTACFGACPKRAVTMAISDHPGELLLVPAGTGIAEVMGRLSPCARSRTPAPDPSGSRSDPSATPPMGSTVPMG